ncbi:Zn(2)-C7 fungal-type transcription factor [Pseudohyphozyma bogoriensis]|nr:Zn(2)-C7 fungal-type transcription factor [Pseudohyphozyma bogoriensis]
MDRHRISSNKGKSIRRRCDPLEKGNACITCRERKVRCTGEKPTCQACKRSQLYRGQEVRPCDYRARRPRKVKVDSDSETSSEVSMEESWSSPTVCGESEVVRKMEEAEAPAEVSKSVTGSDFDDKVFEAALKLLSSMIRNGDISLTPSPSPPTPSVYFGSAARDSPEDAVHATDTASAARDGASSVTPPNADKRLKRSLKVIKSQALGNLSTGSRLIDIEFKGAVISSLLERTFPSLTPFTQPTIALLEDTNFRNNFELVGRRLDNLNDESQVLCAAILAAGAHYSDHPIFVGRNAPKLHELGAAAQLGLDLRTYGENRESACQALLDNALKLVDAKGIMRLTKPGIESVASMLIIEPLVSKDDTTHSVALPFVTVASAFTRVLLEEGANSTMSKRKLRDCVLGWTVYIRDCHRSAHTGRPPYFSDDDLALLQAPGQKALSLEAAIQLPFPGTLKEYLQLLEVWAINMADLAKVTAERLTGVRAKRKPFIDEAFVAHYISRMDLALEAARCLHDRANAIFAPLKLGIGQDYKTPLRSIEFTLCQQIILLHLEVERRFAIYLERAEDTSVAESVEEAAYHVRFLALRQETSSRALAASRRMANIIGSTLAEGVPIGTPAWCDMRASQMLFAKLPMWLSLILKTPATEEGLQCTARPVKEKKDAARTGKRMEAARNSHSEPAKRFSAASTTLDEAPSASVPNTDKRLKQSMKVIKSQALGNLSTGSRLINTEFKGAVISSLLELYMTNQPTIALLEDTNFRLGLDLRSYGEHREAACQALLDNAMKLIDTKGIMRLTKPGIETVASMLLLEPLIEQDDSTHSAALPFVTAASGFTRVLLEEGANSTEPVKARQKRWVDEVFVARYISKMDLAVEAAAVLYKRASAIFGPIKATLGQNYKTTLRSVEITLCQQILLLDQVVGQRFDKYSERNRGPSLTESIDEAAYALQMANIIGSTLAEGVPIGTPAWCDMRASQMLFAKLPMWLSLILKTPTTEEAVWVQTEITKLQARMIRFYQDDSDSEPATPPPETPASPGTVIAATLDFLDRCDDLTPPALV